MNIQEGPRPVQGRPVELQLPTPPPVFFQIISNTCAKINLTTYFSEIKHSIT